MKHYCKTIIISLLLSIIVCSAKAQVHSVMGNFSPSTSALIGSASRIGYDDNNWSTYYMRYNDSSYFCSLYYLSYWGASAPAVASTKINLPQHFVITDFKKFLTDPGFIGSFLGAGMFGYSIGYNLYNNNFLYCARLPEINQLNRTAVAYQSGLNQLTSMKFFSVGEKTYSRYSLPQSCILEYYLMGTLSYSYAPLAYDPISLEQEIADDVITLDKYVLFATRDTRAGHAPVNLRISDTNQVLANSDIDFQWQFDLPAEDSLCSVVRLLALEDKRFILAYTKYNSIDEEYYLCIHRIDLPDFLVGNNSIVSHEIKINEDCISLTEMIFKPNVQTMVILLNGEGKSELYHWLPFSNANNIATRLDYERGNFYSIDTLKNNSFSSDVMYMAMGDSVIFHQNIANGIAIEQSCLPKTKLATYARKPPIIRYLKDPLERLRDDREYFDFFSDAPWFMGMRQCNIIDEEK